jgi:hypothetical protein
MAKTQFPAILANRHYASYHFGAENPGQYMTALPRMKFMFYADFKVNSDAATLYPWLKQLGTDQGISFKIKTIDKPNVELVQKELNQYNRKRYAYTKTEYKPVSITIYDTVDNKPLDLWRQYFTYYFGDARNKTATTMGQSTVSGQFSDDSGWGLRPLSEQTYFFTSLDLYAIHGKKYTLIQYLNPKITQLNWQNYDMTDSGVEECQMTISYETLQYYGSQDIDSNLANKFGFDVGPTVPEPLMNTEGASGKQTNSPDQDPFRAYLNTRNSSLVGQTTDPQVSVNNATGFKNRSYNTFNSASSGIAQNQRKLPVFASSAGSFDNVNSNFPGSTNYSNVMPVRNSGINGIPTGQLPRSTQALITSTSVLSALAPDYNGTLSSSGTYNFGRGGLVYGNGYNGSFGPGTSNLNRLSSNGVSIESALVGVIQRQLNGTNNNINSGLYSQENAVAGVIDTVANAISDGIDIISDIIDV